MPTAEPRLHRCGTDVISKRQGDEMEPWRLAPAACIDFLGLAARAVSASVTWAGRGRRPWRPPSRRGYIGDKFDRDARTCGSIAQNMGLALRRVSASTIAIFFFLISVRNRAVNVRRLPEYA